MSHCYAIFRAEFTKNKVKNLPMQLVVLESFHHTFSRVAQFACQLSLVTIHSRDCDCVFAYLIHYSNHIGAVDNVTKAMAMQEHSSVMYWTCCLHEIVANMQLACSSAYCSESSAHRFPDNSSSTVSKNMRLSTSDPYVGGNYTNIQNKD